MKKTSLPVDVRIRSTSPCLRFFFTSLYLSSSPEEANLLDLRSIMGCPGGHEHDPIYSLSYIYGRFRANFSLSFPRKDCNGKKDRCSVFSCNNERLFPQGYTVKFSFCPKSARKY